MTQPSRRGNCSNSMGKEQADQISGQDTENREILTSPKHPNNQAFGAL